jgi:excisionase family DNA binding protein
MQATKLMIRQQQDMFLTPQEVADTLKVSIFTVRRWIGQKELPAYKVGRGWRIARVDFRDWLESNRRVAANDPSAAFVEAEVRPLIAGK